ncbi:hypothetical protein D3C80_1676210 [compost metagenome]
MTLQHWQIGLLIIGQFHLLFAVVFDVNHHRLQHAAFAAIDSGDLPAGRCREENPRDLLIFKQRLAFLNSIANLYQHGGTHTNIFLAEQRHLCDRWAILDHLRRRPSDWQI